MSRLPMPVLSRQKLLVLRERKPDKQAKDLLYIHDTLLILPTAWTSLGTMGAHRAKDSPKHATGAHASRADILRA